MNFGKEVEEVSDSVVKLFSFSGTCIKYDHNTSSVPSPDSGDFAGRLCLGFREGGGGGGGGETTALPGNESKASSLSIIMDGRGEITPVLLGRVG